MSGEAGATEAQLHCDHNHVLDHLGDRPHRLHTDAVQDASITQAAAVHNDHAGRPESEPGDGSEPGDEPAAKPGTSKLHVRPGDDDQPGARPDDDGAAHDHPVRPTDLGADADDAAATAANASGISSSSDRLIASRVRER